MTDAETQTGVENATKPAKVMPPNMIPGKNGGWLRTDGSPGRPKAGGRPKEALRSYAAEGFEKALMRVHELIDSGQMETSELLHAFDKLGKYGIGAKLEVEQVVVSDALAQTLLVWLRTWPIPDDAKEDLLARMAEIA